MDIILYLLNYIQYQYQQICWLLNFICRYIPLKQWAFDDSHSPKYQKFKNQSQLPDCCRIVHNRLFRQGHMHSRLFRQDHLTSFPR